MLFVFIATIQYYTTVKFNLLDAPHRHLVISGTIVVTQVPTRYIIGSMISVVIKLNCYNIVLDHAFKIVINVFIRVIFQLLQMLEIFRPEYFLLELNISKIKMK